MTPQHKEHLTSILKESLERIDAKYVKGVKEHGGHLKHDYTVRELVENAIDEAVDQMVYLLTILQKLDD